MLRALLGCLLLLFVSTIPTLANGGPVDGSAVYALGDIRPVRVAPVGLVSEHLSLRVEGDFTHVHVEYKLQNVRVNIPKSVTYGFPVEVVYSEFTEDLNWRETYIPEIRFMLDDKPLEITREIEQNFDYRPIEGEAEGLKTRKVWYVTDFQIPPGKLVSLEVVYLVKNGYTDWETTKSAMPSYDKRRLFYDFSPAKYWGNGILPKLDVNLEFPKNAQASIEGLVMDPVGDYYTYEGVNLVLDDLPALYFEYSVEPEKLSTYFRKNRLANNQIQSIAASSTLAGNYGAGHLLDEDFSTAWVEGTSNAGLGAQIEIILDEVMPLTAIGLINGYTKSERTYYRNNRIKKIRIEVTGSNTYENDALETLTYEVELPDRPFSAINEQSFATQLDIPYDVGEGAYGKRVRRVVLTILEVYPGTRYNDTCLSEIFLLTSR